ncbi:MAG: hypothetical protein FVQ80_11480 [Planctomycetes bacterium]|nr:hypothetical protein [Planctomycetota bacterium]
MCEETKAPEPQDEEQQVTEPVVNRDLYFDDEYTITREIPAMKGYPALNFTFRPLNVIQAAKFTDDVMATKSMEATVEVTLALVSKHLVKWDLSKPDGSVVDFKNTKELRRMDYTIMDVIAKNVRDDNEDTMDGAQKAKDAVKNLLKAQGLI